MITKTFTGFRLIFTSLYALLALLALAMVRVNMRNSVYWAEQPGEAKKRYGPGQNIEVPERLATALSLTPLQLPTEAELQAGTGESPPASEVKPDSNEPPAGNDQQTVSELEAVDGIGPELAAALGEVGITTVEQFRAASDADMLKVSGIGSPTLRKLREATKE